MTRILDVARRSFYAWWTRLGLIYARVQKQYQLGAQVAETFAAVKVGGLWDYPYQQHLGETGGS